MPSLGSLVAKVALDYADFELGADRTSQASLKMGNDIERAVTRALGVYRKSVGDMSAANDDLGASMGRASAGAAALAESEQQAAARIKDMVARSMEAQQAMQQVAAASQSAAAGVDAMGASAGQIRVNVLAQTQAMIDAQRATVLMNDEMQALRTTMAQGNATFATLGDQYNRLDRAMATGKLSMAEYDATLAALGKDEDKRLQALNALTTKYDPLGAATRKLAQDQALLDDAYKAGQVTTAQYQQALAGIKADQAVVELRRLADQEAQLERAFKSGEISSVAYKKALADIGTNRSALTDVASAAETGGKAMEGFGLKTAGARREVVVLAHEALTGNWKNFGGSMMVLAERMDLMEVATSGAALAVAAIAIPLVAAGAAMYKVSEQNAAMNDALVLTGGYAGVTTEQLRGLAAAATAGGATFDTAAESVTALAATGRLTGQEIADLGRTTADAATYTSISVKQMVDDFTRLAEDPVKASVALNDQYHYLTASTYDQIAALEKQGDATGAAQIAVEAFSRAMDERTGEIAKNEGIILAGWRDIKSMINGAVEALGSFGATAGPAEVVARMLANRSARQPIGQWDAQDEADLQKAIAARDAAVNAAREKARQAEQQQQLIDAKHWYATWNDQFATPAEKRVKAINEYLDRTAALNLSPEQQLADEQKINDKDKDKTGRKGGTGLVDRTQLTGEVQAIKDALAEEVSAVESARKVLDAQYKGGAVSITDYYTLDRNLLAQAASDHIDAANQEAALIAQGMNNRNLSAVQRAQLANQERKALADGGKAVEEFFQKVSLSAAQEDEVWDKYGKSQLDAMQKQIESANQQGQSLRDQIDTFGMTKSAIDDLKASRADDTVAALEQGRAIALLQGNLADTKSWDEAIVKAKSLATALHGVADDQATLDNLAQAKKQQDDLVKSWQSTIDGIGTDFHNGFLQMLTDGKNGWSSFTKFLKNTFETTVVDELYKSFAKPFVISVVAQLAGITSGSGVQNSILQNNGMGGNGTVSNLLSNPYGTYNNLSNGYNTVMGWIQGYGGASTALGSSAIAGASSGALSGGGVLLGGLGSGIGGNVAASAGTYASTLGSNAYGFTAGEAGGGLGSTLGSSAGLMYGGAGLLGGLAGGALFGNKGYSSLGGSLGAMGGMAVGASSAVAGTAMGASLGSFAGPIGAVIGMALGALVGSLIGGGETRYGADYTIDSNNNVTKVRGPSGGDPAATEVQSSIKNTYDSITSLAKQLGGSVDGLGQYSATYEISPQKGNSFVSAGFGDLSGYPNRQDLNGVKDSTTVLNDFSLQLQRSVIDSLQKANLDAPYAAVLQGVDASKLSANDITSLLSELNSLKSLFDSIQKMGDDFVNLKNASVDAQSAVLNLAGGVDSFNTSATYFYQHFTSAAQQADDAAKSVTDQLSALGYSGIHTRDQFRDLVKSLDLSTDAGQRSYVALLALAPAFDSVVSSYESAVSSAYSTQSQALTSFKDQVDQFRASLTTGSLSTASPEQQYGDTRQRFEDLYSKAIGGDATAQSNLTSAAQDFLNASKAYNASSGQYQSDLTQVMQSMDYASSSANAQLDQLKAMVTGIVNVNTSVQTVAEAIAQLQGWTSVNGSHAQGLYRVPFDGYIAELHQGERVLTASEARTLDTQRAAVQTVDFARYQSSGNDALLQEIKALRAEVVQLREDRRKADVGHASQRAALVKEQTDRLDEQTTVMRNNARPGKKA
ncbi:phage tail length tape measure family protein [Paraburkholderia lacunae]|uniref:Phage tail tape measure protein n=1 Tax=Paraburkholderia lacunae TaxID=2211104 RepID=A0A370N748_9BURK|nr:phage tail length tape measure family protein [Paraburkholderia lacunae]RDK01433.1 phage tail tape measure protein [Paraburkholderia lacunae]